MIHERFAVSDDVELHVSCATGAITVERSSDDNVVEVQIDSKQQDGWSVVQSGSVIEVRYTRAGWGRGGNARIRITAPIGYHAKIDTASADVTLRVPAGRADFKTASGDVRVERVASVTVKTASGDVNIEEVANDVTVSTASGDVSVRSVLGDVVVTTASGDARIGRAAGRAKFSTASGDVTVERYEGASFNASALSGDITVGVPTGRTVEFDAKTLSGRVECPEPRPAGSGPIGEPVWLSINAKSVSGDIRLRRAD